MPQTSPALTSLRFFAAMAVVLYHVRELLPGPLRQPFAVGYIGVPFFFLLSGFVLAQAYLQGRSALDTRRFFFYRFARIYPLYLVAMLLDLPHYLHTHLSSSPGVPAKVAVEIGNALLLVQAWRNHVVEWNGPSWSLSVEFFFYLLFPLAGMALWRMGRRWLLPVSAVVYLGGLAAVVLTSEPTVQSYDPYRHLPMFLLGILLSRYASLLQNDRLRREFAGRLASPMLLMAAVVLVAASFFPAYEALLQHGLLAPVFAAVVLTAHFSQGRVMRWLAHPKMVLLGHGSYAIYLLHVPVRTIVRVALEEHTAIALPAYLVGLTCLGVASFRYFELPARAWVLRRAGYPPLGSGAGSAEKTVDSAS